MDDQNILQKEAQCKTLDTGIKNRPECRTKPKTDVQERRSESLTSLAYVSSKGFFFQ